MLLLQVLTHTAKLLQFLKLHVVGQSNQLINSSLFPRHGAKAVVTTLAVWSTSKLLPITSRLSYQHHTIVSLCPTGIWPRYEYTFGSTPSQDINVLITLNKSSYHGEASPSRNNSGAPHPYFFHTFNKVSKQTLDTLVQ